MKLRKKGSKRRRQPGGRGGARAEDGRESGGLAQAEGMLNNKTEVGSC